MLAVDSKSREERNIYDSEERQNHGNTSNRHGRCTYVEYEPASFHGTSELGIFEQSGTLDDNDVDYEETRLGESACASAAMAM